VKVSLGLPTHHVGRDVATADGIARVSVAAETAGFDAVFVTDHPFPSDRWLATGGHHALDPFVALSFAAAATTRLRLHTNLLVLAYRNPFHSAKAIASLDALSKGRVIVGVGAGYLEPEFEALGVDFEARNELTDEAIVAMLAAWTGESRPSIRRAVELGDGWMPMPSPAGSERRLHTPAIASLDDLADRLQYARDHAAAVGRTAPLEVVFMPSGLDMFTNATVDSGPILESARALAAIGVTYLTVTLPGTSVPEVLGQVSTFADVLAPIREL